MISPPKFSAICWAYPIFLEALFQYASLLRETGHAVEAQQVESRAVLLEGSRANRAASNLDLASLP